MEKTLNELKVGDKGKVVRLKGTGAVKRRLLDMGVVKNTTIEVERVAPLGDPVEVVVKGYNLSLRKDEASSVVVKVLE